MEQSRGPARGCPPPGAVAPLAGDVCGPCSPGSVPTRPGRLRPLSAFSPSGPVLLAAAGLLFTYWPAWKRRRIRNGPRRGCRLPAGVGSPGMVFGTAANCPGNLRAIGSGKHRSGCLPAPRMGLGLDEPLPISHRAFPIFHPFFAHITASDLGPRPLLRFTRPFGPFASHNVRAPAIVVRQLASKLKVCPCCFSGEST